MKKETNVKEFLMKYGFVIILILVTAFFGITTNNFITVKNLFSILHNSAPVFAFCVGAAMVIMSGMVDLSIGSTMYLSAAIGTILIVRKNVPIILALLAVAAICIIIGIINGLVIDKFDMSPMIATMATMIVIRGLAQIVHRRTSFGRYVTTIGNDKKVAEKLGVNVRKTTVKMYVYSALMAGVAGILTAIQTGGVATTFGSGKEFVAISVAAIGGISMSGGSGRMLTGITLGVLTLSIIESGLNFAGASPYAYRFVQSYQAMIRVKAKKIESE